MSNIVPVLEGPHSELGPSAADRWINCPGSVLASRGKPDNSSEFAIEGTAAHTLSEWVRHRGVRAKQFRGITIRVERGMNDMPFVDVLVDDDMVNSVQEFCDRMAELQGTKLVEQLVTYTPWVPRGFGTLDGAALLTKTGWMRDFKHGEGVKKDAKRNPQLLLYALGIYHDYGWMYDFDRFVLGIVQPRLDHFDEWEISVPDLLEWAETVAKPAAILALTPDAPFKAGDWCQFCRIKATCRTRARAVVDAALPGERAALCGDLADKVIERIPRVVELTNDEVYSMLRAMKALAGYRTALEEYAYREVDQGRAIGDCKIVPGRKSRGFILPEDDMKPILKENGVIEDDMYEKKFVSVAKAEKLLPKGIFAKETEKKPTGKLAHLVSESEGKPTLVFGEDKRDSIKDKRRSEESAAMND